MAFHMHYKGDFQYLTIPSFSGTGCVVHGFTTRLGGVSEPPLDSMNLGMGRGDSIMAVYENYRIAGNAIGFDPNRLVFFPQVHENDIFIAKEEDAGMGFRVNRPEYDGIITQTKNLPLATFHADCVSIFLLDPKREVAGVVHAGWRGTALGIPGCAVRKMVEYFGCNPADILAGIGPASGVCCYETNRDVPDAMLSSFGVAVEPYLQQNENEKWHVDLAGINRYVLLNVGVPEDNITMSDICTCCQPETYWSHRKTGGVRGCMAAIIMLK